MDIIEEVFGIIMIFVVPVLCIVGIVEMVYSYKSECKFTEKQKHIARIAGVAGIIILFAGFFFIYISIMVIDNM